MQNTMKKYNEALASRKTSATVSGELEILLKTLSRMFLKSSGMKQKVGVATKIQRNGYSRITCVGHSLQDL